MTTGARTDTEVMSVSIIAGPAATSVVDQLRDSEVFRPTSDSTPEEIINRLKAIAQKAETNHLVIQCDADRPAMAYASLFADPSTSLTDVSRLTSVAFAIDPTTVLDALLARKRAAVSPCFLAEHLEFVSQIFLDENSDFEFAQAVAAALNPQARIFPLSVSTVAEWRDERKSTFDFEAALNGAQWRKLLHNEELTPGRRVLAFGYNARRPFHPQRFWDLLQKGLPGLFRAKGFFWLATRMDEVGGLNLAGSELQCASAGQWWAVRDAETRESQMPKRTRKQWQEPFGDRRQSFAIMARGVDRPTLQNALDLCLLTDAEMAEGPEQWRQLPDPFPAWSQHHTHPHSHVHDHDEHCHHHHDSEEHHCCNH